VDRLALLPILVLLWAGATARAEAQAPTGASLCQPVESFLTEGFGMVAETEADTINDARTAELLPGCRVTAGGGSASPLWDVAGLLWDQLAADGWEPTPVPRDIPQRGARRLRKLGADCLFAVYHAVTDTIGSDAQLRVNRAYHPYGADERFNVIVQCVPAKPSAF
jgi:hypothetical protein